MQELKKFIAQQTADGSFTFFSSEFNQTFHSLGGAKQEAERKFVEPTQLIFKAKQSVIKILDICYGLGYNTAAALARIWAENPDCRIECIGLEIDIDVPRAASASQFLNQWQSPIPQLLAQLAENCYVQTDKFQGQLLIGDARKTIQEIYQHFQADAIFLDPFSPTVCPQLWTVEFLSLVAKCLKPDGYLATYSCSAAVRAALIAAGLNIGSTTPVGRKSPGTVASFLTTDLPRLSQQEQEHLQTRAAVPYRDPYLKDTAKAIAFRRLLEQQASSLEPSSHWKKRWLFPYLQKTTANK